MAKAKKRKAKKKVGYKGSPTAGQKRCGCGPAKVTRVKNAEGSGRHTMCRDVNGVTRKKSGKRRQPGSFSKAAGCQ